MEAESSNTHAPKQRLNMAVDFPIIKCRRRRCPRLPLREQARRKSEGLEAVVWSKFCCGNTEI